MAEAHFRVIITGEIAADFNYSDVVKTAARLFKCSPAQAQKLLGNHPTTLKRAMDKQTAMLYCQQLLKAGIVCRIENDTQQTAAAANTANVKVNANHAMARDTDTQAVSLVGLPAEKPSPMPKRNPINTLDDGGLSLEPVQNIAPAAADKSLNFKNNIRATGSSGSAPQLSLVEDPAPVQDQQQQANFEPTATHEIICPKCKNVQRVASECSHCGVVFSKYVGDKNIENEADQKLQEVTEASAKEWQELSWFVGENFESYRHKFEAIAAKDDKYVAQWHWPAFLVPYAWFIHRKLYPYFAAYFAYYTLMIIIGVAPIVSALIGNTICALAANYIYYRHVKRKLEMCDDDIDARRIDIIEAGETNTIFVTLAATLGLIIFSWILIFNLMVRPVVNALMDSMEQDQAFVEQGTNDEKTTRAGMVMLKNVVIGTKMAKEVSGEHFTIPADMDALREALKLEPAAADLQFKDGWDNPMHYFGDNQRIRIESAGADGKWNSEDDIVLESRVPKHE